MGNTIIKDAIKNSTRFTTEERNTLGTALFQKNLSGFFISNEPTDEYIYGIWSTLTFFYYFLDVSKCSLEVFLSELENVNDFYYIGKEMHKVLCYKQNEENDATLISVFSRYEQIACSHMNCRFSQYLLKKIYLELINQNGLKLLNDSSFPVVDLYHSTKIIQYINGSYEINLINSNLHFPNTFSFGNLLENSDYFRRKPFYISFNAIITFNVLFR